MEGRVIGALSADRLFAASEALEEDMRLLSVLASLISKAVKNREERHRMLEENRRLLDVLRERSRPEMFVGRSPGLRAVLPQLAQVAPTSATVLLLGERGTPEDMQQLRAITDGLRAAVAAGEGNAVYARWMRRFDTTIAELSGNRIFPLLMNSLADVSGVLWERCVGFWGAETGIEQELRIIDMLSAGRGRDAALYIENIYHHSCDAHADA